jgi:hypothetical protein
MRPVGEARVTREKGNLMKLNRSTTLSVVAAGCLSLGVSAFAQQGGTATGSDQQKGVGMTATAGRQARESSGPGSGAATGASSSGQGLNATSGSSQGSSQTKRSRKKKKSHSTKQSGSDNATQSGSQSGSKTSGNNGGQ